MKIDLGNSHLWGYRGRCLSISCFEGEWWM